MKIKSAILILMLAAAVVRAQSSNYVYSFTENLTIPAGNPVGVSFSTNLTGMSFGGMTISNVTVSLDISGGFNGNLYAYLAGPGGTFAVLLNRSGMSSGNAFGYANSGFNITLNDQVNSGNIHTYQNDSPSYNGSGQLTGTWAADGENVDPNSSPSVFDTAVDTVGLSALAGGNPDGQWTLFLADLASGPQSTVVSWSLDIMTVPEPSTLALAGLGGMAALVAFRRRVG
jgi:subtilisin-like proprotein convertase family protein